MVHQRLVVVELALGNVHLGFGRIGLLLCLAYTRLVFGLINACDHLTGLHAVPLAHAEFLQLTGHTGFDDGTLAGLEGTGYRDALAQTLCTSGEHVGGGQLDAGHHGSGWGCWGFARLALAGPTGTTCQQCGQGHG